MVIIRFMKKNKNMICNFLLLMGILTVSIIFGEILLRILIAEETSRFGFGPGNLKFNKKYIHLNEEGFRDNDYPLVKEQNTFRIVGIGDSFTYGSGVKDMNHLYLKQLETMLNEETDEYDVMNFGKPGINTKDEIEILKQHALKYEPDMIVVGYVLNDFTDVEKKIKCKTQQHTLPFFGFWLRNFSYLYYFLETRINKIIERINIECAYGEYLDHIFQSEKNKEYNFKQFEELSQLSKENDAELIVIIFPMIHDIQNYNFNEAHNFVKEAGAKYGFKVIDLLPEYQKYEEDKLIVSVYDNHPNELGHEIAARAIYSEIKDKS